VVGDGHRRDFEKRARRLAVHSWRLESGARLSGRQYNQVGDTAMSAGSAIPITRFNFATPIDPLQIPPLKNGDRLTLREFMRRYEASPEHVRVELIEGIVYVAAAVRLRQHGLPHGWLGNIVTTYGMRTGLECGDNSTTELDPDNAPEPDLLMLLPVELGSGATVNEKGYVEGPPDFIAEVSASTVSIDLHGKLRAYQKSGVKEYVVWRVREAAVDWFVLQDGKYIPLAADENGVYRSQVFPGLWLNVPALLRRDAKALWATLDEGMATSDYREFAARVAAVHKE
jgi:Uma2 family endonuclease